MKKDGTPETKADIRQPNEWERTRHLYSQLYLTSTMQNLLLQRIEPRFAMHGMELKQKQKYQFKQAYEHLKAASRLLMESETDGSQMGWKKQDDFFRLNDALNREAYFCIRVMLSTENAIRYLEWDEAEKIVDMINALTTGKTRTFPKKMIDGFKLEEDK